MVRVTGEQLQNSSGLVRAEARRAPVEGTTHGRPEPIVLSAEDDALLRRNRKLAFERAEMPIAKVERIANNRMDAEHAGLDALMDDHRRTE